MCECELCAGSLVARTNKTKFLDVGLAKLPSLSLFIVGYIHHCHR